MSPKTYRREKTLKRNLTDEELDIFFGTNYPFQNYPKDILIMQENPLAYSTHTTLAHSEHVLY